MPIIENDNDISWTFVRAAMISLETMAQVKFLANLIKECPGTKIMLGDLAKFIVEQITSTSDWIKKKSPALSHGIR